MEVGGQRYYFNRDWNNILGGGDMKKKALALLKDEVSKNLTAAEWWLQRWTKDAPALLAIALGWSQGDTAKVLDDLIRSRDTWLQAINREHHHAAHKDDSPVQLAAKKRLLEEWEKLEDELNCKGITSNAREAM